ncbi:MAG: hypothetical protein UX71_C0002G0206 [Parcubacteria group bacterium GW2011_GWA1_47_10]|nr:MAG: hypothetical protein UX71_C0002G0206 [Parcubacteria group bacterium GW2011_GWA1_47_10]
MIEIEKGNLRRSEVLFVEVVVDILDIGRVEVRFDIRCGVRLTLLVNGVELILKSPIAFTVAHEIERTEDNNGEDDDAGNNRSYRTARLLHYVLIIFVHIFLLFEGNNRFHKAPVRFAKVCLNFGGDCLHSVVFLAHIPGRKVD